MASNAAVLDVGGPVGTPVTCDLVKEADRVRGHNVRVEDGLWALAGKRAKAAGYSSRTALLVAFLRWYCRMPGARLPQRPGEDVE